MGHLRAIGPCLSITTHGSDVLVLEGFSDCGRAECPQALF